MADDWRTEKELKELDKRVAKEAEHAEKNEYAEQGMKAFFGEDVEALGVDGYQPMGRRGAQGSMTNREYKREKRAANWEARARKVAQEQTK